MRWARLSLPFLLASCTGKASDGGETSEPPLEPGYPQIQLESRARHHGDYVRFHVDRTGVYVRESKGSPGGGAPSTYETCRGRVKDPVLVEGWFAELDALGLGMDGAAWKADDELDDKMFDPSLAYFESRKEPRYPVDAAGVLRWRQLATVWMGPSPRGDESCKTSKR